MEYSDRDQLIQHQDNNAMFDDYIQPTNASLLTALEGKYRMLYFVHIILPYPILNRSI